MMPVTPPTPATRSRPRTRWPWQRHVVSVSAFSLCLAGCSLIDGSTSGPTFDKKPALPPIQVAPESIQLDLVFVERLDADPLWSDDLWASVDQISNLPVEQRVQIDKDGLFVGVVGSNPPPPLQRLLELQTEMPDLATSSREKNVRWQRTFRLSGESAIVEASPLIPELDVSDVLPHQKDKLFQAQAVLDIKVERLQDGWIKLHVTPEIHHGQHQLRPVASEQGFEMKASRQVIRLVKHQFTLSLNVGEMMLLSSDRTQTDPSLGRLFFHAESHAGPVQRLVLIRLSDMKKLKHLYHES